MAAPRSTSKKLTQNMRNLLKETAFSDVTLILPGGHTIKAHKAILSSRCEKFKLMFASSPKELTESRPYNNVYDTRSVEIKCDDPVAFTAMVEYLYTSEVNFSPLSVNNTVNLGYLASEFSLHELAFFCRNSLVLSLGAATVCKVFSYAFECDDILRLCCLDFICQRYKEVEASGSLLTLVGPQAVDLMRFLHSKATLASHRHRVLVTQFGERALPKISPFSNVSSFSNPEKLGSFSPSFSPMLPFRSDPFAFNGCLWQFSFEPAESVVNVNLFLHNYSYMASQLHFSLEFIITFGENIKIVSTHDFEKVGSVYGFVIALPNRALKLKEDTLETTVWLLFGRMTGSPPFCMSMIFVSQSVFLLLFSCLSRSLLIMTPVSRAHTICPFLLSVFDEFCDCPSRAMYLLVGGIVTAVAGYKILQNVKIGKRESFKNLPLFSRPFGLLEKWYAGFQPPRMFTQAVLVDGPSPSLSHVIEIMKVMCERFPTLTTSLQYSSTMEPSYSKLDFPHGQEFPVRVEKRAQSEWEGEITKELNTFFTPLIPSSPLWRLIVLVDPSSPSHFSVVVSFHHILADGLSGTIFLKNFVQLHNDLSTGKVPNKDEIKTLVLEDVVDVRPTFTHLMSEVFKALSPAKKVRSDYIGPPAVNTPLSTTAFYLKLKEDTLIPLREACKREQVTLHGALSAALLYSAVMKKGGVSELSLHFPISLRKNMPKNENANFMGLCLGGGDLHGIFIDSSSSPLSSSSSSSDFWNLARKVNSETESLTKEGVAMIGMLKYLPVPVHKFVNEVRIKDLPNARNSTVELSNLGVVDFSSLNNVSDWEVKELFFGIPGHITGPVFCNGIATVGNTLTLLTTLPHPVLAPENGKLFQQYFYDFIVSASKNPSS